MSEGQHEAKVHSYFQPRVVKGTVGMESKDKLELWLPPAQTVGFSGKSCSKPPFLQYAPHRTVVTN